MNINKAFRITLSDYPITKIEEAFRFHLKHNKEFPVPADIVHIIERGNKPPLRESVYIALNRKNPEGRTAEEWNYINDYEQFMLTGGY